MRLSQVVAYQRIAGGEIRLANQPQYSLLRIDHRGTRRSLLNTGISHHRIRDFSLARLTPRDPTGEYHQSYYRDLLKDGLPAHLHSFAHYFLHYFSLILWITVCHGWI